MAQTSNSIQATQVVMYISTNTVTPDYKAVVCSINNGLKGTREVTTTSTKCGTAKAGGSPAYTIDGSLAANTAPSGTEMSHNELIALFESGAQFLWKLAHISTPANYYRQGAGFFSAYNETANDKENVLADFTIEVEGGVDSTV